MLGTILRHGVEGMVRSSLVCRLYKSPRQRLALLLFRRPEVLFGDGRTVLHSSEGDQMNWAILVVAGLFEIGWAIGLKYTEGFTRLWPTVGTVLSMIVSLWLLGIAMKGLPVGTAYSVWVGVGSVGTVIFGILLFGEPVSAGRLISAGLIIAGIVGLKLAAG
jgi:quaternary ammonium compound-resistance protein SugE